MKLSKIEDMLNGHGVTIDEVKIVRAQRCDFKNKPGFFVKLKVADNSVQKEVDLNVWEDKPDKIFDTLVNSVGGTILELSARVEEYKQEKNLVFLSCKDVVPKVSDLPSVEKIMKSLREFEKKSDDLFKPIVSKAIDLMYEKKTGASPFGCGYHGDCEYGLIRHVEGVASLSLVIASRIPSVDIKTMLSGAILHDIGKVTCYADDTASTAGARRSRGCVLFDHVILGMNWLKEKFAENCLSKEQTERLEHIVVSHHAEFKEISLPATIEAVIVSSADVMESQVALTWQELDRLVTDKRGVAYSEVMKRSLVR